jgi:hypothetical protein
MKRSKYIFCSSWRRAKYKTNILFMKSRNFGKSNWLWSFWFLKRTALHEEEQIFSWLFEYEEDKFRTLTSGVLRAEFRSIMVVLRSECGKVYSQVWWNIYPQLYESVYGCVFRMVKTLAFWYYFLKNIDMTVSTINAFV